jgi:hypothetical protein
MGVGRALLSSRKSMCVEDGGQHEGVLDVMSPSRAAAISSRGALSRRSASRSASSRLAPAIRAAIMARADLPLRSLTTTPRRTPASASTLPSRFFSAASMPTSFWRWRATRRSRRSFSGGTNEGFKSPARASIASHSASQTSVLCPGTFLT